MSYPPGPPGEPGAPSMAHALRLPNGFSWCDGCGASHPADHPHVFDGADPITAAAFKILLARSEFAESLVCALAFDHQRQDVGDHYGCDREGRCIFCEATR